MVAEALVEPGEPPVIEALLRNDTARLSSTAVELLVAASRDPPRIIPLLLRRGELRPRHAYVMFWWADADARRLILQRFAVSREVLQDAVGDVFSMAADESWSDPLARKALQFIERRQRNRAAIEKSPYGSLDEAVGATAHGMTREKAEEISYLSRHQADDRRQDLHRSRRRAAGHPVQGDRPAARGGAPAVDGHAPARGRRGRAACRPRWSAC